MVDFYSAIEGIREKLATVESSRWRVNDEIAKMRDTIAVIGEKLNQLETQANGQEETIYEVNEKRHIVIGYAQNFVNSQLDSDGDTTVDYGLWAKPKFIINRKKRTVVCLLKPYGMDMIYRGKAKCSPDEVFNVHIGKAIAFGRAKGLIVPERFLHAPQPEEAEVGDIVKLIRSKDIETLSERKPKFDHIFGRAFITKESEGWIGEDQFTIIDDSKYEGDDE